MTNFEKLTQSPAGLGAFLRGLPILEGPWDDEFHKRYCRKCPKSPLRGGVKLTLKKARELALQEFGTAKGIQREENALPDYYIMRLGNMRVRIAPDTYGGTGCILVEVCLNGYGRAFQLHDPETLQEDFEAEEERLRKERREALQDWVSANGIEACRAEVEKIWNGA